MLASLCAKLLAALVATYHPESLSHTRLVVQGREVESQQYFDVLSILEVLPEIDRNADLFLDQGELDQGTARIVQYLGGTYTLESEVSLERMSGARLSTIAVELSLVRPESALDMRGQQVLVDSMYRASKPIRELMVDMRLFQATSPNHRDFLQVQWPVGEGETVVLSAQNPRWLFHSPEVSRDRAALLLGLRHSIFAWDHPLYLLALVLALRLPRALLRAALAFLIARSFACHFTHYGIVRFMWPANFLEAAAAIALSYTAAQALLGSNSPSRGMVFECTIFGLLEGPRCRALLEPALQMEREPERAWWLCQIGVELGLALVLALCWGAIGRARLVGPSKAGPQLQRRLTQALAALLLMVGCWRFLAYGF